MHVQYIRLLRERDLNLKKDLIRFEYFKFHYNLNIMHFVREQLSRKSEIWRLEESRKTYRGVGAHYNLSDISSENIE